MTPEELKTLSSVEATQRELASLLKVACPPGWGFCLMMFEMGEGKQMTYISSCERQSMVQAIRECADVVENRADRPPVRTQSN